MKKLFQYVIIHHVFDTDKEYVDSEIICGPTFVLAKSDKEVLFKATREVPEQFADDSDNVEILIRNF